MSFLGVARLPTGLSLGAGAPLPKYPVECRDGAQQGISTDGETGGGCGGGSESHETSTVIS